jgi:hypothetical protein
MQENKNLVEEALIQMKNVEEAIAENAKGILASTMKEEISQLVKESLSEQEELDLDADVDMASADDDDDTDVSIDADMTSDDDSDEMEVDMDMDVDSDNPIDLSDASDEFILKVFKSMGEDDGIIVKKDGDDIHLTDNNTDSEYLVKNLGESEEENYENMEYNEQEDEDVQDVIDAIFSDSSDVSDDSGSDEVMDDEDEVVYEIEFTEDDDSDDEIEESEEMDESDDMDESEEMDESDDMDESEEMDEENWQMDESYSHKKSKKVETKESKMSVKPKGVGMGKAKFSYKKSSGGFSEDKKEGPKTMGTGKAKFEYKKGENMEGDNKIVKKSETKEAARTLGFGPKKGALRKGITNNRNMMESLETEVSSLREKNEEYRKALNVFREKLNEVAIFNSNLAYATRLFTEHSTTKKEKINILRRFDDVDSLKESKGLYKVIKEELTKTETKSINESVGNKLTKSVQSGSSTTLIESKTYENPQFMRIKDLITKIR